jgi:signal transduction histidine kinase/CheY-like chemotaxis protein
VPVLVGGTLFEGSQGVPAQSVIFALDLTERRRAEADREALKAAEAATQAKSEFLANMSHELRTPLNAILGFSQLMQLDSGLAERHRSKANTIYSSGNHLLALINDILDLSRAEAGKQEFVAEPMDLRSLIDGVADIVRVKADEKELPFEIIWQESLPRAVVGDERRLRQVLLNLLANAVKFTERGRVTLTVRSTPESAARVNLSFEVQDTGIGISSEDLARLFRPFEQAGTVRQRSQGTGLGLVISDMLVRHMGGEISVQSTPGMGSRFQVQVSLPVADAAASCVPRTRVITGYGGRRRIILVADDNPESRSLLVQALSSLEFVTAEAADGLEALERATTMAPDLILLDNGMPGITGNEALQRMRAQKALADVPVITVSASASADDQRRCLAAGASAFFSKPVDIVRLLGAIGSLLQLDWTYHDSASAPQGPLVAPPTAEAETLYGLARMGNMRSISAHADHIETLGAPYGPLARHLRALADKYESRTILELAKDFVNRP